MRKCFLIAMMLGISTLAISAQKTSKSLEPVQPTPTTKQVEWQKMETYAFIHFGLNTFNDKEWGYGNSDVKTFNPKKLDCEQWARTLAAAGMKGVIITAKHHDGFCLWPTHTTDYCIRNTPYKNGEGDVVGELSKACQKYGLKFGIYLSPWDRNQASYGSPYYLKLYQRQLKELLSNYGELFEIWFDGANGGDGWYGGAEEKRTIDRKHYYDFPKIFQIVDSLQPNATIFGDGGPGCRWVGNENGFAGETCWSMIPSNTVYPGYKNYKQLQFGWENGDQWTPAECDVSIRPGWFYHETEDSEGFYPLSQWDVFLKHEARDFLCLAQTEFDACSFDRFRCPEGVVFPIGHVFANVFALLAICFRSDAFQDIVGQFLLYLLVEVDCIG
jgi:alpha-L-fucosidase